MNRTEFHKLFKATGPVVLPVIHVLDTPRTLENVRVLVGEGAAGCFLINHDFGVEPFEPIIRDVRNSFPSLWMAVNFLAVTGRDAFPVLGRLQAEGCQVDGYWADDARIDEASDLQTEANEIDRVRQVSGWTGLYFGGTAFKKQREVAPEHYETSARKACPHMDVITTSGVATGKEVDLSKIEVFRRGIGDRPMALASGITPDNAHAYADVDCFMVATGINRQGNFYDIDAARLKRLMRITRELGGGTTS
jgi:predicted TIM-barrel enzyme